MFVNSFFSLIIVEIGVVALVGRHGKGIVHVRIFLDLGNSGYIKPAIKTQVAQRSQACLPTNILNMSSTNSSIVGLLGTYPYQTFAALFCSFMLFRRLNKGRERNPNGLPLPPGPKGYPLIGNLFDMPTDKPWVVYDEWRKTYGKVSTNGLSS